MSTRLRIVITVGDWKVSELESVRIHFYAKLESVRIGKCQNWKVSELLKIGKCQNPSSLESVIIGKCQKLLGLESVRIGKCPIQGGSDTFQFWPISILTLSIQSSFWHFPYRAVSDTFHTEQFLTLSMYRVCRKFCCGGFIYPSFSLFSSTRSVVVASWPPGPLPPSHWPSSLWWRPGRCTGCAGSFAEAASFTPLFHFSVPRGASSLRADFPDLCRPLTDLPNRGDTLGHPAGHHLMHQDHCKLNRFDGKKKCQ